MMPIGCKSIQGLDKIVIGNKLYFEDFSKRNLCSNPKLYPTGTKSKSYLFEIGEFSINFSTFLFHLTPTL